VQGVRRGLLGAAAVIISFALIPAATASAKQLECSASFRVLHDDRVGKLQLPKGNYTITVYRKNRLSCERASKLFTRFLEDFDGKLPGKWKVRVKRSGFFKGNSGVGFTVERGTPSGGGGGGGGGTHPANGGKRCPNTFRVLNNDRIGELRIPAGNYHLTRLTNDSPNCQRVAKLFAKFLEEDYAGKIPGWRVNVNRAKFIRNKSGGKGFRIKPVR
jgi:hypothetical protein